MSLSVSRVINSVLPIAAPKFNLGAFRSRTVSNNNNSVSEYIIQRTMSSLQSVEAKTPVVPVAEAKRFVKDCMEAIGTPIEHAEALGDLLAEADYRGHFSHGMNRLEYYIADIKDGNCDSAAVPEIINETPATAWVDGKNALGAVIGNFCMELAMQKAKKVGVGWVCTNHSNHYGIAGMYSLQAIRENLIGFSFTNTSPFMTPTRGKQAALGTNPISMGAPAKSGDSFVLDMATTAVAVGKIEIQQRKNAPIPSGWAQDKEGNITTDSKVAYEARSLMPLGGPEESSGYKGFGLGLMVEILCGILGGSNYGRNIREWNEQASAEANLGQCFIAVDPNCFAPNFEGRLSDLMDSIRSMDSVNPNEPILVAGDPERLHMAMVDQEGGVRYLPNQLEACDKLAAALSVEPLSY